MRAQSRERRTIPPRPLRIQATAIGQAHLRRAATSSLNKTQLDRVFADAEDDGDSRGRSFAHLGSKVAGWRGDNGHAPTHEFSHERRKAIELALQPVVLHRYVLALDVAGFVEALAERGGKGRIG